MRRVSHLKVKLGNQNKFWLWWRVICQKACQGREMKNNKSFIILFSAYDLMREILEHLILWPKTFSRFSSAKDFKMRLARDSEPSTQRFWKSTDQTHFSDCNACGRKLQNAFYWHYNSISANLQLEREWNHHKWNQGWSRLKRFKETNHFTAIFW